MLNKINLDDLVSRHEFPNAFTYSYVKYQFCCNTGLYEQKCIHLPTVDFESKHLIPIYSLVM